VKEHPPKPPPQWGDKGTPFIVLAWNELPRTTLDPPLSITVSTTQCADHSTNRFCSTAHVVKEQS